MNYHHPDQTKTVPGRKVRRYVAGVTALALLLGGYWYYSGDRNSSAGISPDILPPVHVAAIAQRDIAVVEHTIGTVVANDTVTVVPAVQGELIKADFKEGQLVKKGDLLFEIDPRSYKAAYDNAYASMDTSKAKAQRYAQLLAENAIARQDADDANAAYLEAKANTEAAALNLEFTKIRSPVDGTTGPILVQPGNFVAGTGSGNGNPPSLVVINQIQPIKVSFSLPQSDLPRIQARARKGTLIAVVSLHEQAGPGLSAPVNFVSNAVGSTSGTIELRATFPNKNSDLVPGQLVDVTVALEDIKGVLVVPRQAVSTGPDNAFVDVVDSSGIARQRSVKIVNDDGVDMAIEGDVKPGERIIVDGQMRVQPDRPVTIIAAVPGAGMAQ